MVLLSVNVDHTVMMRSDLSTFLPTLGLLGAVLKKIRLRTHKKHQKTQKIYSKDLWHCTSKHTGGCILAENNNYLQFYLVHNCLRVFAKGPAVWQVVRIRGLLFFSSYTAFNCHYCVLIVQCVQILCLLNTNPWFLLL